VLIPFIFATSRLCAADAHSTMKRG
jgi:hypothetical protein